MILRISAAFQSITWISGHRCSHDKRDESCQQRANQEADPRGIAKLGDRESGPIRSHAIKDGVVKLINPSIAQNEIEAHGCKTAHKDKCQEIGVKPGYDERKNEEKNKKDRH